MVLESRKIVMDGKDNLDGASIASFYASLVGLSNRAGDTEAGSIRDASGKFEAREGVGESDREKPVEGLPSKLGHNPNKRREKFSKAGGLLSERMNSNREASTSCMNEGTDIQLGRRGPSQLVDDSRPTPGMLRGFQRKPLDYADFSKEQRRLKPEPFAGDSGGQNVGAGVRLNGSLGAQDKRAPAYRMRIPEENIGYKVRPLSFMLLRVSVC